MLLRPSHCSTQPEMRDLASYLPLLEIQKKKKKRNSNYIFQIVSNDYNKQITVINITLVH